MGSQLSPVVSIVVPAYNEAKNLPEFSNRLRDVMNARQEVWEVIFVDDGSLDETFAVLKQLRKADPHVAILSLSRNFGKEIAITAGLDHSRGDAVVIMDADLQDPPELIPELVSHWQQGFDTVYARRRERRGETWVKKATAAAFYKLIGNIANVKIPPDTGDFRLISRRVVEALKTLREHHRFMKGLFAWVGFPTKEVFYSRDPRFAGESKWNYWRLWNLALEGITGFTILPLKVATYLGMAIGLAAAIYFIVIVFKTILLGNPVSGYPSLMSAILFLGGAQLVTLGIIGEYLGRIFDESKKRPLYLVQTYQPSSPEEARPVGSQSTPCVV